MKPSLIICFVVFLIVVLSGLKVHNVYAKLEAEGMQIEEIAIRQVIQTYFDKRYQSRAQNRLEDFGEIRAASPQAISAFQAEFDKLEIEMYNAEYYHLKYVDYDYTLDYQSISIDIENKSATVILKEGYDVIFEISQMINSSNPIVSKMRNRQHQIRLIKEQSGWKIASDAYDDTLWRMMKATRLPKEEVKRALDEAYYKDQVDATDIQNVQSNEEYLCSDLLPLQSDLSTHSYNRSGAVAYAHEYALSPNASYFYFPGNDCTSFVNQAIHHGSNAAEGGANTIGWYYNSKFDYSPSWTEVNFLFDFITQYYYNENMGPEGCQYNHNYMAKEGDLVQFEWGPGNDYNGDESWDHTAIIVSKETPPDDPYHPYYYIAQHSDDLDNHPLHVITYQSIRFLNIVRIDGSISEAYLPLLMQTSGNMTFTSAYPAPLESNISIQEEPFVSAYPAP